MIDMAPAVRRAWGALLLELDRNPEGWVSGNELFRVAGTRYGARLYELKHKHGINWEKRFVKGTRVPQYRLSDPVQRRIAL